MSERKKKIARVLAFIGLIIITIFLCIIAYAMLTQNGRLALAMIIALVFVSVLFWIGIKVYKDMAEFENLKNKEERQKEMNDIARMNTKNI